MVTQFYWPEELGTAFYTHDLAKTISQFPGWELDVITGEPYYPRSEKFEGYRSRVACETHDGVTIHRLVTIVPKQGRALWRIVSEFNFLFRGCIGLITRRIRRRPYVFSFAPGLFAVLLGVLVKKSGGRHVTIVHDVTSGLAGGTGLVRREGLVALIGRIEGWVLNRCDAVAVLSRQMAETLTSLGVDASRLHIVPLWIREELFPGDRQAPLPATPTALYSGSFARKQGLERVIALAETLQQRVPEARVALRGDGPMRDALQEMVVARRISNITFLSPVEDAELQTALSDSWVHLVPQEPSGAAFSVPSKALNALACGRPAVATAYPGTPLGDLGSECPAVTVVDPDDPDALAGAVVRLLSDRELCESQGRMGRTYAASSLRRNAVLTTLIGLVEGADTAGLPGVRDAI